MKTRKPNCGPYVVTWQTGATTRRQECQTWTDACYVMRGVVIAGYVPSVGFV